MIHRLLGFCIRLAVILAVLGSLDSGTKAVASCEVPPDVAATHLRPAETALEELLGIVSVDDVLDVVFREFCIGK